MRIQSLAVIFIIIILPISLVLANYTQSRVETLSLQADYDTKLKNSTYDALKAYQLNSFNSVTSAYVNEKMRDVNASVNTFFNSLATNFSTVGYTKETLQNYVPAVVYTMYDGYYIYSPFTNNWTIDSEDQEIQDDVNEKIVDQVSGTYSNGQKLYNLKPYVYYSCRYVKGNIDVIITYSLDNYISIQGTIEGNPVSESGYVLDIAGGQTGNSVTYQGITIGTEDNLKEQIIVNGISETYPCKKINGTKYYLASNNDLEGSDTYSVNRGEVFSVINGKANKQLLSSDGYEKSPEGYKAFYNEDGSLINSDDRAVQYYIEASNLRSFIEDNGLDELTIDNLVDLNGNIYTSSDELKESFTNLGNEKIFEYNNIEAEDSNFNTHRIDVIKYTITRNLSVAITNFNNYTGVTTDFQMPQLKDTDWDKIMDNISIISFLQGMSIGGKVYNGYSVVTNTKNDDVVMEDSIYIKTSDNVVHRVEEVTRNEANELTTSSAINTSGAIGIYNINIERRTGENSDGQTVYYMPISGTSTNPLTLSYTSIVTQNNCNFEKKNTILSNNPELAKIYYTALGRERYSMYREKLEF